MEQPDDYPRVSVVTVFYNRRGAVQRSMQSLLDQTYPNIEILAVDDGSTDGTGEALSGFGDSRLTVWRKDNSGFTDSVDRAVKQTTGEFVAIHGSGDRSLPERISAQENVLRQSREVGVVGSWRRSIDSDGNVVATHRPRQYRSFRDGILQENMFLHGDVMFRRTLFDSVGGYRRAFRFAQDRDLWIRMSRFTEYRVVEEYLYDHVFLPGSITTSPDKQLVQSYLADFAVQCGETVDRDGYDPLEKFGTHAFLMRRRSRKFAERLALRGLRWMRVGQTEAGWMFLKSAMAEYRSPIVVAKYLLGATHLAPPLWSAVILPALKAKNREEY